MSVAVSALVAQWEKEHGIELPGLACSTLIGRIEAMLDEAVRGAALQRAELASELRRALNERDQAQHEREVALHNMRALQTEVAHALAVAEQCLTETTG